ncbi:MAG: Flp family type IVb pilin [Pseudomonadota bacterium]
MKLFHDLLKDESGATAIEYGLIAALVSVAIIGVLSTLGDNLTNTFQTVSDNLGVAEEAAEEAAEE